MDGQVQVTILNDVLVVKGPFQVQHRQEGRGQSSARAIHNLTRKVFAIGPTAKGTRGRGLAPTGKRNLGSPGRLGDKKRCHRSGFRIERRYEVRR